MNAKRIVLILLVFLLPALACNMPTAPATPSPNDPRVADAVQQTLAARIAATAGVPSDSNEPLPIVTLLPEMVTPLPGEQPVVPGAPPQVPGPALIGDTYQYPIQPGDTLAALAGRFGVEPEQILDPMQYPPQMMLPSGQTLLIPNVLGEPGETTLLLPDTEIVYSPAASDFDVHAFVADAGGYLSIFTEQVGTETLSGAEIVERVALETSTNPRLLLAVLEYRSGWVFGSPNAPNIAFPIGFYASKMEGLQKEMTLVARQLQLGYYGWRSGKTTELEFLGGGRMRVTPTLNPGTVSIQYLFAKLYKPDVWRAELYDPAQFLTFYSERFGDPWARYAEVGPVIPANLSQPEIELPFPAGQPWVFTGGPHAAWGIGSPLGGLDFAPANVEKGCEVSRFWVTSSADGVVVRSERGMVLLDLDGDGEEGTGWVLLYLHVAEKDRVAAGTRVSVDDPLGHPSCEGGFSTGTHVHITRKYNGEWIGVEGPIPFVMSGWTAFAGARAYSGAMTKGDQVVNARPDGSRTSIITR